MQLIDWLLPKLRLELAVPATFRVAAAIVGWVAIIWPWSATPLHVAADLARNRGGVAAHQFLLATDTWFGQDLDRRQLLGFAGVVVLVVGARLAVRYRVNAIENLSVSATWIGVVMLRQAGCPTWLMLLAIPVAIVMAAVSQVVRFGNRNHRLRDRLGYGLMHLGGSLLDPLALFLTLLGKGPSCLGWQWIAVNPRAEFWRRLDTEPCPDRAVVQPQEPPFVMFGPAALADWIRDDPRLSRSEIWRMLKRQRDVEWGLS